MLTGVLLLNATLDRPHLWLLYVVAGLTAAVDGIQRPAMEAMIPRLVRAERDPGRQRAATRCACRSPSSPARRVAGILIATVDLAWVYAFDLATFAVSLICLALVRAVPPPPAADRPSLRSVVTGLRYAGSRPELLGTYLVDINAMFFGMPQALYPFLAKELGGPSVLGLLYAAPAVGSLLATLLSGWTARVHRHGLMVLIAAGVWGLAIIGAGLTVWLWLALLVPGRRGRRRHDLRAVPHDHLEPDDPGPSARQAGRDRDAVVHDRAAARPCPRRAGGPAGWA